MPGTPDRTDEPRGPRSFALGPQDFLQLELELADWLRVDEDAQASPPGARRVPMPTPVRAPQPAWTPPPPVTPAMPAAEALSPGEGLRGNWPEVRTNSWRVREPAPPPARSAPAPRAPSVGTDASWLFVLDDARLRRAPAGLTTRIERPRDVSFRDEHAAPRAWSPWLLRGLLVVAGLGFVAAIGRALLAPRALPPAPRPSVLQPEPERAPQDEAELMTPAEADADARARALRALQERRAPQGAAVPRDNVSHDAGAALAADRADDPRPAPAPCPTEEPALAVYTVRPVTASSPLAAGLDLSGLGRLEPATGLDAGTLHAVARDRLEQWLARSRGSADPLADAAAVGRGASTAAVGPGAPTGVWDGATVPIDALTGSLALLTPAVGRVRVRLTPPGSTEGRLHAIGQGHLWLDTAGGRVVLDAARIATVEQLAERAPSEGGAADAPTAGARVRVRSAGGVFFGRVVARDGRSVTLVTDDGTRLTVECDEISPAGAAVPAGAGADASPARARAASAPHGG